jgi:hypothetical protein
MAKREGGKWIVSICGFIGIFILAIFIPVIHAEPIDITDCWAGTASFLVNSEDVSIRTVDVKGIIKDNLESKVFDNLTFHCVGFIKVIGGKRTTTELCKYMDPSGDFFIVEAHDRNGKFIHGTGKWKGITGGWAANPFTRGKPIIPDTLQGCAKLIGSFELPK